MSIIDAQIRAAAKSRVDEGDMNSVLVALDKFGLGLVLTSRTVSRTSSPS